MPDIEKVYSPDTLLICPKCGNTYKNKDIEASLDIPYLYVCPGCGSGFERYLWKPFINVKPLKTEIPIILIGPDADTYSPLIVAKCPGCGTGLAYCPDKGMTATDCHICGRQVYGRIHSIETGLKNINLKKDSVLIMPDMTIRETGVRPEQTVIDDTEG